jgi:hypothetical protein
MTVVIIMPRLADQARAVDLLCQFTAGMATTPYWKWVGKVENGSFILYNENNLSGNNYSKGTVYRYIRPGDIIIIKDGKYIY